MALNPAHLSLKPYVQEAFGFSVTPDIVENVEGRKVCKSGGLPQPYPHSAVSIAQPIVSRQCHPSIFESRIVLAWCFRPLIPYLVP